MNWAWAVNDLPLSLKLVLLALADHHNAETGRCDPGARRIATRTCLSERTVRTALGSLSSMGLIRIEHRDGRRSSYALAVSATPANLAGVQTSQGCEDCTPPLKQLHHPPAAVAGLNQKETGREPSPAEVGDAAVVEPENVSPAKVLFTRGLADLMMLTGAPKDRVRTWLGTLQKRACGDPEKVLAAIERAKEVQPAQPLPWLMAAVGHQAPKVAATKTEEPIPDEESGYIVKAVIDRTLDELGVGDLRFPDLPRVIVALLREGVQPDHIYSAGREIARRGVENMRGAGYLAAVVRGRLRERQAGEFGDAAGATA